MATLNLSTSPIYVQFPPITAEEASKAAESFRGTARYVQYAKLRNFLDNPAIGELLELSGPAMDANWNLQRHFGHIKMISTNPNSERCKNSVRELAAIGLAPSSYEIVQGVAADKVDPAIWKRMVKWGTDKLTPKEIEQKFRGQAGCYLAHYNTIKETATRYQEAIAKLQTARACEDTSPAELLAAIEAVHTYSSVLIFEDNIGFGKVIHKTCADTKGYGTLFRRVMKELPQDWDMFYLMSMNDATQVSEHCGRLEYGLTAKCYALSAKMYERALTALEVFQQPHEEIKPVDHILAKLHKTARAYVSLPPLAYRAASKSEVGGDLGKKIKKTPQHWQRHVSIKTSPEEQAKMSRAIETQCAAASNRCRLPDLMTRAAELRANDFAQAKKLLHPVNDFTDKWEERKANKKKANSSRHIPESDFDATDITLRQTFMFAGCPKDYKGAGALMSVLLARQGNCMVSTLESHEAAKKGNNFWKKEHVSKFTLLDGSRVEHISEKDIDHGAGNSKIVETTLSVANSTLTHLHYYGWVDRNAAPDDRLLFQLIMRMRELNPNPKIPFSINCHGGVGRTGTTGVCTELFHEIDAQLQAGIALDSIEINVLETIFKMRRQGRDILHHATAFAQVFAVVGMYYNHLKK